MVLFVKQFLVTAPLRWLRTVHLWLHYKSLNAYSSKSPQKGQHLATKFFIYRSPPASRSIQLYVKHNLVRNLGYSFN